MFAFALFAVNVVDDVDPNVVSSIDLVAIEPNSVPKVRFRLGICYRFVSNSNEN